MDLVELPEQRAALQSDKIHSATSKIEAAYGEKSDPLIQFNGKQNVSELLWENRGAVCLWAFTEKTGADIRT